MPTTKTCRFNDVTTFRQAGRQTIEQIEVSMKRWRRARIINKTAAISVHQEARLFRSTRCCNLHARCSECQRRSIRIRGGLSTVESCESLRIADKSFDKSTLHRRQPSHLFCKCLVCLQPVLDEADVTSLGRLFHTFVAATGKARPPTFDRRQVGTSSCSEQADLSYSAINSLCIYR